MALLNAAQLLPDPALRLRQVHLDEAQHVVLLEVATDTNSACCPACGTLSRRIHSRYQRKLADLPWATFTVRVHLHVHKWHCASTACPRKIFTERLPTVAPPWARRTTRLAAAHRQLALVAGGLPASRLSASLHLPLGKDALLTALRRTSRPFAGEPRVVGIDDFAFRKRTWYGTILVDLEAHRVLDVLPDREAKTVGQWLQAHPSVQVVSRDRAACYAEAANLGAPEAEQVADRWHLLKNLGEAVLGTLQRHHREIHAAFRPPPIRIPPVHHSVLDELPISTTARQEQAKVLSRECRQKRHADIHRLRGQGCSITKIAGTLGLARGTVYKYLASPDCPERRRVRRRGKLDAYYDVLLRRWNEGCHSATALRQELLERGVMLGRSTIRRLTTELRRRQELPAGYTRRDGGFVVLNTPVPDVRTLAFLVLRRPEHLGEVERRDLDTLMTAAPMVHDVVVLAWEFAAMVHARDAGGLFDWVKRAETCGAVEFKAFASGLFLDWTAVRAALSSPWSNGQTEGQVNKLKTLKRQMYGRAKLDLLRARLLVVG